MDQNILNLEELYDFLMQIAMGEEKGTLELKNSYLIKQLNYQEGIFNSWHTSNRNRQMGNIGFCLLQQGFVSCNNLHNAFLDQVQQRKHYCEILVDRGLLSTENLQIAIEQVLFEELAEIFTWENGKFRSISKRAEQSSMYGNPYLQSIQIKVAIEKVISQIPNYLDNWKNIKEKLNNFNVILYINDSFQDQMFDFLCENYILYDHTPDKKIHKIFANSIAEKIQKNISFFNKKLSLKEIIPLLTMDPLSFCRLVADLMQHNYLLKMSMDQIIDLAENSKIQKNTSDTKKLYRLLLQSKEVEDTDKKNIKDALYQLEKHTSGRIQKQNLDTMDNKFPGYEVLEEIGRGAMGTVYRARQKSLNRDVAIKVVRPNLAIDEIYIKRLELEAKTMAKLRHPSIVSAIDFRFRKDLCYIVMEYIPGGVTLLDLIAKEKVIKEKEALRIGISIASALRYLYQNHLVHRDIKPSNILLDKDQVAKLADLGLIKDTQANSDITLPGSTVGTPAYMSPEQLQMDSDIDIRSDIYSLGAALLYAVTGKSRFHNAIPAGVIYHKIISQGTSYVRKEKELSARIKNVLSKMLEPEKSKRYQTPDDLMEDLERTITGKPARFARKSQTMVLLFLVLFFGITTIFFSHHYIYGEKKTTQKFQQTNDSKNTDKKNVIKVVDTTDITDKENKNLSHTPKNDSPVENKAKNNRKIKKTTKESRERKFFLEIQELYQNKQYQKVIAVINKLPSDIINPEILVKKGYSYIYLGKYQQAKELFLEIQTKPVKSFMGLSMASYLQGEIKDAVKYIEQVKQPSTRFHYLHARIYFSLKQYEKAQADLKLIRTKVPNFWQAHYLSSLLWKDNQPKWALEYLNIAFKNGGEKESGPLLAWLYYYKGVLLYLSKNQDQDAYNYLKKAHAKIQAKEILPYIAMLQAKKKKYQDAIDSLNKSLSEQESLKKYSFQDLDTFAIEEYFFPKERIHYERGRLFAKRKNYKSALRDFQNAININIKYMPALQEALKLYTKQKNQKESLAIIDLILELKPNNLPLHWQKANIHFLTKNYKKAAKSYTFLIEKNYKKELSLRQRAKCYLRINDNRAIQDIEKILKSNPNDTEMIREKARIYKKNTTESISSYQKIFDMNPSDNEAYKQLIDVYLKAQNYSMLASIYETRLKVSPRDLKTLYGISRCYIKLENYSKSAIYLEKIKNINPNYLETLFFLGMNYYSLQQYDKALVNFTQVVKQGTKNEQVYFLRGNIYFQKGMYRETVIDLTTYLKYSSQDISSLSLRAFSYKNLELYRRALKDYQNLELLSPNNYEHLVYKGECETKIGMYKSAINSFEKAQQLSSLDANSYNYRGYCYAQIGKMNKAIADYKQVINRDPNHALARANYAITLYAVKEYQKALEEITTAISLDKKNINALESRGKIYLKLKKYDKAVEDFSKVISRNKSNGDAYYYLALSFYKLEDLRKAGNYFKKAIGQKIGKKESVARRYLRIIKARLSKKG